MTKRTPKVGIGVMILKEDKVLLGERIGSHGEGEFAFPGGHLEYMESFEDCAKRETLEECGIEIDDVSFQFLANMKDYAPKHYVHIGVIAKWKSGEPQNLEPHMCKGWKWYDIEQLPERLFIPVKMAIEAHKSNNIYLDS
jgi:8-oxo-dGTP diphosphatase